MMQGSTHEHLGNWLLVSEEKDFFRSHMDFLKSLIFEGTRVTVLKKKYGRGKFLVYSIHVDADGSMQ